MSGYYLDTNRDHRNTVFLAGSGRSGTTWVSDVINYKNDYRLIFEPFHPNRVQICRNFKSKQYLRPDDRRKEFLEPAKKIVSGAIRDRWIDRFHKRFLARRRLIKDIRANLLLRWLHANFPEMKIVLLLRHPYPVVESRLRLGWRDNLAETMSQEELVEDFLLPFEAEIQQARTPFERHVFLWCIDNYVPLRQFGPGEVQPVFYENLLAHPEDELDRLFSFLGKDFDERVYQKMQQPSALSNKVSGHRTPDEWRRSVSIPQLKRTIDILALFGLEAIYGEDSMPNAGAVWNLAKAREQGDSASDDSNR